MLVALRAAPAAGGPDEGVLVFVSKEHGRLMAPAAAHHGRISERRVCPEIVRGVLLFVQGKIVTAEHASRRIANHLSVHECRNDQTTTLLPARSTCGRGGRLPPALLPALRSVAAAHPRPLRSTDPPRGAAHPRDALRRSAASAPSRRIRADRDNSGASRVVGPHPPSGHLLPAGEGFVNVPT